MAGRKLGRSSNTSREGRMSAIFGLDDDDPYNFKGSQSLQLQGSKSNSIHGSGKRQSTLAHYTSSSSSTPASMRSVKITPKRTPVQLDTEKNLQSKLAKKPNQSKRSPGALTERERLRLKEKEDLERALKASLQTSRREERQKRRLQEHKNEQPEQENGERSLKGMAKEEQKRVGASIESSEVGNEVAGARREKLKSTPQEVDTSRGRVERENNSEAVVRENSTTISSSAARLNCGSDKGVMRMKLKKKAKDNNHFSSRAEKEDRAHQFDTLQEVKEDKMEEKSVEQSKEVRSSEDSPAHDRLCVLSKPVEEESDSEAEYVLSRTTPNKLSPSPLKTSAVADKETTLPIVISEGEEEAGSSQDSQASLTQNPLVTARSCSVLSAPNLKAVMVPKLKLKVTKSVKESTPLPLSKRASTPELVDRPEEKVRENKEEQSGHREKLNHTPSGRHLVITRKAEASGSRTGMVASGNFDADDIQATPPLINKAATSVDIGEAKRNQVEGFSKRKLENPKREKKLDEGLSPRQGGAAASDRVIAALPLQKKPRADIRRRSSGGAATVESSGTPNRPCVSNREDKIGASIRSSSTKLSPVRKCKGHSQEENGGPLESGSPALFKSIAKSPENSTGTARTRMFDLSSRKKRVAARGLNRQQSVTKRAGVSPSNMSGSKVEETVVSGERPSTIVGGRKRPLSKSPSHEEGCLCEPKKGKIMETSASSKMSVRCCQVTQNVTVNRPKEAVPASSDSTRSQPPLFFAPKGKSPEDYSKVILKGLDQYISLLADAQSKVLSRIKWGEPITIVPKRSRSTLRSSSQSQVWQYALPLRSNVGGSLDVMEPDQLDKSNETDVLGVIEEDEKDSVAPEKNSRGDAAIVARSQPSPNSQDGGRSSSEFIPLVSYHEESDVDDQGSNERMTREGSTPTSERIFEGTFSDKTVGQNLSTSSSSGGMSQGKPQVVVTQECTHSISNNDLLPVDTEETCLGDFEAVIATAPNKKESRTGEETTGSSSPRPSAISNVAMSSNQKKVARKRWVQESDSGTPSEDEHDGGKERSSLLTARNSRNNCSVSTPIAKRARVDSTSEEEVSGRTSMKSSTLNSRNSKLCGSTPSTGRKIIGKVSTSVRTDRSTVKTSEQSRQKGKITSAAARLLLSTKGRKRIFGALQDNDKDPPQKEDCQFTSERGLKRKPAYDPRKWLSSDSDIDSPEELIPSRPSSTKLPRKQSKTLKTLPVLPSSSDSDFNELAKFTGSTKEKNDGTIDLTEETFLPSHGREQKKEEVGDVAISGRSSSRFRKDTLDSAELNQHRVATTTTSENRKNMSECVICNKMFASSLIELHIEQCNESSTSNSDEEETDLPTVKVGQRSVYNAQETGERGVEQPQTARDLETVASVAFREDEDDVIEISDNEEVSNPSSGMSVGGEDSAHQSVRAIRCDDGSYLVEPSGSSPIHTFTRLQDMDRNERSQYQNQYQYNKGSSSRKRQQAGMPSKSLGNPGKKGGGWSKSKKRTSSSKNYWKNRNIRK